jgi:hypothetical protein
MRALRITLSRCHAEHSEASAVVLPNFRFGGYSLGKGLVRQVAHPSFSRFGTMNAELCPVHRSFRDERVFALMTQTLKGETASRR